MDASYRDDGASFTRLHGVVGDTWRVEHRGPQGTSFALSGVHDRMGAVMEQGGEMTTAVNVDVGEEDLRRRCLPCLLIFYY